MPFNPARHHRRSIRLLGYDYTQAGAYFVTICTHQREPLLGELNGATVAWSQIGRIVAACWQALPMHAPHVELDAWVIMPDHLHSVIVLHEGNRAAMHPAPVAGQRPNGTRSGSLNAVIQSFKSVSTRKANRVRHTVGSRLWQRDYYETVIRDEQHLHAVRYYIAANPQQASASQYPYCH